MTFIRIFEDPMASEPVEIICLEPTDTFEKWLEMNGFSMSTDLPFVVLLNGQDWRKELWSEHIESGDITVTRRMFGIDPISWAIIAAVSIGSAYYMKSQIPEMSQQNIIDLPNQSPTYDASVQTNHARLNQPVPAGFGYQRIIPDLASRAYRRYVDGVQILYHVLSIGHFEHTLHHPKIADTPFSAFSGIRHKYFKSGEPVDLFPTDVLTSSEVERIQLYAPNDPDFVGSTPEYIVAGVDSSIARVEYDFVINGLYNQNKETGVLNNASITIEISYQEIDDNDVSTSGWSVVNSHTFTDNSVDVIRLSHGFDTSKRGRIKMVRTSASAGVDNSRIRDSIDWSELRVFLDSDHTYNHAVWAVEIPVTDQVGSRGQNKISVERQTLLPVYDGTSWSAPQSTRNPIWALIAGAKASFGGRYSDDRLNLTELKIEADKADVRGDYFDYQFDTKTTVGKMFEVCARAARCEYTDYSNQFSVVRDEYKELAQMQFGARQIERESFEISYPRGDAGDQFDCSVEVEYIDSQTWETKKVLCVLPGEASVRPFPWKFEGCTDDAQAMREGMFVAAKRKFRNSITKFKTEMDGQLVRKGMPIGTSWNVTGWGQSGDIIAAEDADDGGKIITLREPVEYIAGQIHQIVLRGLSGRPQGPYIAVGHGNLNSAGHLPFYQQLHLLPDAAKGSPDIYTGYRWDKTSYNFGPANKYEKRYKVTDHIHQGSYKYLITAVVDDPRVYQYDDLINNGSIPLPPPSTPFGPELEQVRGFRSYFFGSYSSPSVDLTWLPVALAERYIIQASKDLGVTWKTIGSTVDAWFKTEFNVDYNKIRIAAHSAAIGPWFEEAVSLAGTDRDKLRPNTPDDLALLESFVGRSCKIMWSNQADAARWRVSVCNTAGDVRRTIGTTNPEYIYKSEDAVADGLGRDLLFKVWAVNVDGDLSFEASELTANNPQIGALTNVAATGFIKTASVSVSVPAEIDFKGFVVWASANSGFALNDSLIVSKDSPGPLIAFPIENGDVYIKIAGYDCWGRDDLAVTAEIKITKSLIENSQLSADLTSKIELIDVNAAKIAQAEGDIAAVQTSVAETAASLEDLNTAALSGIGSRVTINEQSITAQSQSIQALSSSLSVVSDAASAAESQTAANASSLSLLTTKVTQNETGVAAHSQSIQQLTAAVTATDTTAALAATASSEAKVTADQTAATVSAQMIWKASATAADGTVTLAGFGLSADSGAGSKVLFRADKIGFLMPGAGTALALAIENGKTVIANASIGQLSADKIDAINLSSVSADLGTVTAGKMVSADGKTVFDLDAGVLIMEV